jgi:hypothetical protein
MKASIVFALVLMVGCGSNDKKSVLIPFSDAGAGGDGEGGASNAGASGAGAGGDVAGTGGKVATSCDIDMGTRYCIDWSASFVSDTKADCATNKGAYAPDGACDLTDVTGGCEQHILGGTQTVWYRSPVTADEVMVTCQDDGNAVFVAP